MDIRKLCHLLPLRFKEWLLEFFACFYLGDFLLAGVGGGRDKEFRSIMRVLATHSIILAWRIPGTEESLVGYI